MAHDFITGNDGWGWSTQEYCIKCNMSPEYTKAFGVACPADLPPKLKPQVVQSGLWTSSDGYLSHNEEEPDNKGATSVKVFLHSKDEHQRGTTDDNQRPCHR